MNLYKEYKELKKAWLNLKKERNFFQADQVKHKMKVVLKEIKNANRNY